MLQKKCPYCVVVERELPSPDCCHASLSFCIYSFAPMGNASKTQKCKKGSASCGALKN